jgi:flagellar M-ring protein FliF
VLEFLRQLASGIAQTWNRLSVSARANLVLAGVFSLVLIAVLVFFGSQPQYGRLFDRLSLDEANEITVYLTDNDIPFRLRDGGTAIDVPVSDISRARVGLAALNLPKSQGVVPGFELFDSRDLMSNRFLDDIDYMRALQGTLQRQLNQFEFVRGSSVFIREAPDQLFTSEQRPSEATVTVDTGGKRPSDMQIKAIVNTVSSFGGANLSPRHVNVTMSDGTILHSPSTDEFASLAGDKLSFQMAYEETRQKKIMEQFRSAGRRAVVNVNATFDWTSEEKKQRDVREGAEISTMSTETTVRDLEREAEGPAGATENIPAELAGTTTENIGILTETTEDIANLDPSETVTTTTTQPGTLKKITVAAFIEGNYAEQAPADGGESAVAERVYTPLSAQEVQTFTDMIVAAVGEGTEPTEVVVYSTEFPEPLVAAAPPVTGPSIFSLESQWFQWTWRVALVLLAFLVIRFLMRRALVLPPAEEEEVVEIPEASPAERRRQEIAAEVERLSQQEPETVAALLRTWMGQEE